MVFRKTQQKGRDLRRGNSLDPQGKILRAFVGQAHIENQFEFCFVQRGHKLVKAPVGESVVMIIWENLDGTDGGSAEARLKMLAPGCKSRVDDRYWGKGGVGFYCFEQFSVGGHGIRKEHCAQMGNQ